MAALGGHAGQRADHVVGLDAGHVQHRPAEQPHHLVDRLDLQRRSVGIAERVALYSGTSRRGRSCPWRRRRRPRSRPGTSLAQLLHHAIMPRIAPVGHAVPGAAQVGQRVEGAVQVAGAVDQQHQLGRLVVGHCLSGRLNAWRGIVPVRAGMPVPQSTHVLALLRRLVLLAALLALCTRPAPAQTAAPAPAAWCSRDPGSSNRPPEPEGRAHPYRGQARDASRSCACGGQTAEHHRAAQGGDVPAYEITAGDAPRPAPGRPTRGRPASASGVLAF